MRPSVTFPFVLLLANACTWWSSPENVLVTSDPLGAAIFVDGTDTGHTTPHLVRIGGNFGKDHVVDLRLAGHRDARRVLCQYTEGYTSKWIDGASVDIALPPLPIFWTTGDFLFPFGIRGGIVPDLHVKLYREDEPKLGFEVLAERAMQPVSGAK